MGRGRSVVASCTSDRMRMVQPLRMRLPARVVRLIGMRAHRSLGGGEGAPVSGVRGEGVEVPDDQKRQPLINLEDLDGVQRYGLCWCAHDRSMLAL